MRTQVRWVVAGLATLAAAGCSVRRATVALAPPVVRIVARDFAFDAPDSIDAGPTTIRVVSHGTKVHVAPVVRLSAGHSPAELLDSLRRRAPKPPVASLGGVGTIEPGDSAESTIDLAPGLYAIWCDITNADSVPHFMKGMFKTFIVTQRQNGATMPAPDVKVGLVDYAFTAPESLSAGRHVLEVRNTGTQLHMALFWKLRDGVSASDAVAWMTGANPKTDPPITLLGGVPDLDPGRSAQMVLDVTPGNYLFICLDDDVHDHRPHFLHGMVRQIAVH